MGGVESLTNLSATESDRAVSETRAPARSKLVTGWSEDLVLVLLAAAVIVVFPKLLGAQWIAVGTLAGTVALAAVGMDLLSGYSGQLSLGQNGFVAIGSYGAAIISIKEGLSLLLGVLVGTVAGAVLALIAIPIVTRTRQIYLALITLALGLGIVQLASDWTSLTGGLSGLASIHITTLGTFHILGVQGGFYWLIWGLALIAGLSVRRLGHSLEGTALRAMAVSPDLAAAVGIRVNLRKTQVFLVAGVFGALAGAIYMAYSGSVTPDSFGTTLLIIIITAPLFGGRRTGIGALFGAIGAYLLVVYSGQNGAYQELIFGAIYVVVLLVFREGLIGTLEPLVKRIVHTNDRGRFSRNQQSVSTVAPAVGETAFAGARVSATSSDGRPGVKELGSKFSTMPNGADQHHELAVTGIEKRFGGVEAVRGVSLKVETGTVVGLIGANGAGKSTLLNVITGVEKANAGRVTLDNDDLSSTPFWLRTVRGIARTFQGGLLIQELSVVENVAIGCYPHSAPGFWRGIGGLARPLARDKAYEQAKMILSEMGLADVEDVRCGDLSYGQQRLVELARSFATRPKFLLLDEPMAGLTVQEKRDVVSRLRLGAAAGLGVVLVEHDIDVVSEACDWIYVMADGRVIAEGVSSDVFQNSLVVDSYLGVP